MKSTSVMFLALCASCMPAAPAQDPQELTRAKAARDFGCTAPVQLESAPPKSPRGEAFVAEGCGQKGSYEVICSSSGKCTVLNQGELVMQEAPTATHREAEGSSPTAQSSGPVSISLTSACPRTAKLFFGNDPAFGSGRSTTLGGNSRESASARIGDKIWLLDDRGKGVASVSVGAGMNEVHVSTECSSLTAR